MARAFEPVHPDHWDVPQTNVSARALSWCECSHFSGERDDLTRRVACLVNVAGQASAARRLRENDALADPGSKHRWIIICEPISCLTGDHGARCAAVEHETRGKLRAEDARLAEQAEHLGGGPSVERRRLRRDENQIGCKQCRAHQPCDARRTVNDDVVYIAGEFGGFPVQRISRKADEAKEPWDTVSGALPGPVECRALWIGIYENNPLPFPGPLPGKMQGERRLADAAFLVEERDDHRSPLAVFHWPRSPPTARKLDSFKLDSKLGGPQGADLVEEKAAPGS